MNSLMFVSMQEMDKHPMLWSELNLESGEALHPFERGESSRDVSTAPAATQGFPQPQPLAFSISTRSTYACLISIPTSSRGRHLARAQANFPNTMLL